ncbi:phosphonate C-P lyase system protein PhnH [Pannonibacter indicus]|uniref:phosphonate C-P lyase system protein PhnH n=1 Tax=Pannonibacter indicus TaxID=466044 RepID=UPI0035B1547A
MTPNNDQTGALTGGFAEAPIEAARAFRCLLEALARPGTIHMLDAAQPPLPVSPAAGTVLLTLADTTTPVFLAGDADCEAMRGWITFHTGAPVLTAASLEAGADAASIRFALGRLEDLKPFMEQFSIGDPDYPDRSATLVLEVERLAAEGCRLTGPGIADEALLNLPDPELFRQNHALFPLGLDFFLTAGRQIAGLPRTTIVEAC